MRNVPVLLTLALFAVACSSVKNDHKTSIRPAPQTVNNGSAVAATSGGESHFVSNSPASASSVYASGKKIITFQENNTNAPVTLVQPTAISLSSNVDNNQEELRDQKTTMAQMEMFHQIEMDKAIATVGLKKVMQGKVYTTEVRTLNDSSSRAIVSHDTVYALPQNSIWYPVK